MLSRANIDPTIMTFSLVTEMLSNAGPTSNQVQLSIHTLHIPQRNVAPAPLIGLDSTERHAAYVAVSRSFSHNPPAKLETGK